MTVKIIANPDNKTATLGSFGFDEDTDPTNKQESVISDNTLRGTLIIYDKKIWENMSDENKQTFKYCKIIIK